MTPEVINEKPRIEIVCADCLGIMKTIPDKSIDLMLTDPPYGINNFQEIEMTIKALKLSWKKCNCMAVFLDWRYGCRVGYLLEKLRVGELIWEYGWISGGRTRAKYGVLPTHNTIHLFGNIKNFHFIGGTIIKRQPGFSSPRQCSYAIKTGHPFEKPKELIKYLLKNIDCNTILDPFMGSGTTGVAAKELGRNFIGIEIEPKYYEIAKSRIQNATTEMFV